VPSRRRGKAGAERSPSRRGGGPHRPPPAAGLCACPPVPSATLGAFTGALINAYRHDDLAYGATVGSLFGGVCGLALAILDGLLGS
jgi:hypothetical protein